MSGANGSDVARQAANVVGAVFQVVAGFFLAPGLTSENYTLIQPATYAFFVWAPIFLFSLAYAVYAALPSKREDPVLRRVGWPLAGAFFLNGALTTLSYPGLAVLTWVMTSGVLACLGAAYLRLARGGAGSRALTTAGRWLVALPIGLFFGWITAATVVGASQTLSFLGLAQEGGTAEALVGAALLLLGALFSSVVVLAGRGGPPQGYLAYAAAVAWGLAAIAANQFDASVLTAGAALLSAALPVLALLGVSGGGTPPREAGYGEHLGVA